MVECFNGRVQQEVLDVTVYSHEDPETLLAGYDVAYIGRRQRAVKGLSPEMLLRQRLKDKPDLASPPYLPTGWCEATGSEHGRPRCNDGLRGVIKADSLAA